MKIKILFNNKTISKQFIGGWGFSCLVDGRFLFDTGESAEYLSKNMQTMGIDTSLIEAMVLSHDHWDHTGGLVAILGKKSGVKAYGCPGFSQELKHKIKLLNGNLVETDKLYEINQNIFITGAIPGVYKGTPIDEQALIVRTVNGITIITGCAHPGILNIVEIVKDWFTDDRIYAVLGGFHLHATSYDEIVQIARRFKELKVAKAGPAHCSGDPAIDIFQELYGNNFLNVLGGITLEV